MMAHISPKYHTRKAGERGPKRLKGWQVVFKLGDRKQDSILYSSSVYKEKDVEKRKVILQELEALYKKNGDGGTIDEEAARMLQLCPELLPKLIQRGIIQQEERITLGDLWARYIDALRKADVKPTTYGNKKRAEAHFFEYFRRSDPADGVTRQTAQAFKDWAEGQRNPLSGEGYTEATIAGWIRDIKAAFNWAEGEELLKSNPFERVKKGSFRNPERVEYVPLKTIEKVMEAAPSTEWRALLLLARRQGLRVPSETNAARWEDVDFQNSSIIIHSSKTERYKGKGKRMAPLFPDVKKELLQLRQEQEEAGEDSPYIFPSARGANVNLRTKLERIIERAGVESWEKIFNNLRASAATDISETFGELPESEWVGHSPETAKRHYLKTTPERFQTATNWNPMEEADSSN